MMTHEGPKMCDYFLIGLAHCTMIMYGSMCGTNEPWRTDVRLEWVFKTDTVASILFFTLGKDRIGIQIFSVFLETCYADWKET